MVTIQVQNLLNLNDGSDYAGMEYVVVESWTPVFEVKTKHVASGVLDQNGHAAFEIKMKNKRIYNLSIAQPENICYGGVGFINQSLASLDHKKNNNINFEYGVCGSVNVPTNNFNCEGPSDKLWYKYYYTMNPDIYLYRGFTGVGDTGWDPNAGTLGCLNYAGDYYEKIPAGDYTFEWHIERPSGVVDGIDYFTVTENDTTTYLLEY